MRTATIPIDVRFWSKVDKTQSGCWLWPLSPGHRYGVFSIGRKQVRAHRMAWELTNGRIPAGMCVCHKCDIPSQNICFLAHTKTMCATLRIKNGVLITKGIGRLNYHGMT